VGPCNQCQLSQLLKHWSPLTRAPRWVETLPNTTRICLLAAALACVALLPGSPGSANRAAKTPTRDGLALTVADLVTSPSVFRLTPATVDERLRPLLVLESASKTEYLWTFAGAARDRGVARARVDFQPAGPGEVGEWSLLQIEFGLALADLTPDALYRELHIEISGRLGAPTDEDIAEPERGAAWVTDEYHEIAIRMPTADRRADGPGSQVIVSVSVLQGEPEN
jgi:hypothetical protein